MVQPGVTPVDNWIYGNEVDAHWFWHNLGNINESDFRDYFSIEFRQAALVLAKYHPEFRVLLSHTHHWLSQAGPADKSMPSKSLIDGLNTIWKSGGNFAWDLASHPYPQSLFVPSFWNDSQATDDFNTTKITYKNYEVLPEYFQRDELLFQGEQRDISLTEQGFHTTNSGSNQNLQAAAYAYHWHRFKRIPGFKADILHRFADHPNEGGLLLGIVDLNNNPKESYRALAAAGTPGWRTTFDSYLPLLPFSSWDDTASLPAWTSLDLPFDEPGFTMGWKSLRNIGGLATTPAGNLAGTVSGSDPNIGNDNFFALERGSERILIRMKTNTGSRVDFFWGTQTSNSFVESRKFTASTVPDNNFHIYDIDTLDHPEWNDRIIRSIRLDPTNLSTGSFELDYILTGKRGDFDQDGISDIGEGITNLTDTDADGIPDFADPDSRTPAAGYTNWSTANAGNQPADLDFDNDGISNGVEYFMGETGSAFTSNPSLVTSGSVRTITWPKNPAFAGTFKVQVSETLANGSWTDIVPPHASIDENVEGQISYTLPAGSPKRFVRFNVTVSP